MEKIFLSDIDPTEGITDMRDLFPEIKEDLADVDIGMDVLVRHPNETVEEFIKRCSET